MTVRWKPLLILSGLFVVIALAGVAAIAYTLMPAGAEKMLASARAERRVKQFDRALIHYKQALQVNGKNPAVHEEMAAMFGEWAASAPADKARDLDGHRLTSLAEAARYGKNLKEPRRLLLAAAVERDEVPESLHWSRELLTLEPGDPLAHYVLATEALEERTPNVAEIKRSLTALEAAKAAPVRLLWIKAKLANSTSDPTGREAALVTARGLKLPANADPVDRTALLRLRALDTETTTDSAKLAGRVAALQEEARALVSAPSVAPNRVMRMSLVLEKVQKSFTAAADKAKPADRTVLKAQVDAIESDVEAIFQKSLAAASKTDLHIPLIYADHLRFRGRRERCLEVVADALKSPLAALPPSHDVVMGLHAVAVETALADTKDQGRFEKAAPHIKALIASAGPRFQGLGHLFQGAIELEQSGVVGAPTSEAGTETVATPTPTQPKLRASALNHLKLAATQLPDVVEAQARYGVALILSQEQALGRQYLQKALTLGNTDPQYQIWAAWSMVQAGYPEEAEPIVKHLQAELGAGRLSPEMTGTLHLLTGEIRQARRSPEDLKAALADYEQSFAGKEPPAAVQLRMAQIDVQLGKPEQALARIEKLRASKQGGTGVEHLAVLILLETDRKADAYATLRKARGAYPNSDELAGLEASVLVNDRKAREADKVLADFLVKDPENVGLVLMRAGILADNLDQAKEARRLLNDVAERTENSAPLVQLALLDLKAKDHAATAATIARIRSRWKDAAVGDLLDAQLALDQNRLKDALTHFDAALAKDPSDKVVQFWRAQVASKLGDKARAVQDLDAIVRQGSSKELDTGVSLSAAAQSSLANLALQNGEYDAAIRRFESLRSAGMSRADRWQLAAAYAAKRQWPAARRELAALLNDNKTPATLDERVRAANIYRQNNEEPAAVAQLDYVLGQNAAHPTAVVVRAFMLSEVKKNDEAAALIRKGIAASGKDKPPAVFFLMLAALENRLEPKADAPARAMTALDRGLETQPGSTDLIQAKYQLLQSTRGNKEALAFVESAAKADEKGTLDRLLAEVYRDQGDFASAEQTLRKLGGKKDDDAETAAALVQVTAQQAVDAAEKNDRERERSLNEKTASLLKEYRAKFPNNVVFLQQECELAFRRGDFSRATAVTKEIDQLAKNSPIGPVLRARLYDLQNRPREAADAYAEALQREPNQPDIRLFYAQTCLRLDRPDEAARQARAVRETNPDRGDAVLLEARALAQTAGTEAQTASRRAEAATLLTNALKNQPKFAAAYHALAEVQATQGLVDEAAATLKKDVQELPDDTAGLAQLIELLSRPGTAGTPSPEKLTEARAVAEDAARRDTKGGHLLAVAVGYHKADQFEPAMAWAEKAAAKLDAPVLHLNYGDILLSVAERTQDADRAKSLFRRAVDEYDRALKTQADSVEAVNNKAWILHSYLGESKEALEVANGLLKRVDPTTLPGEFYDTLGAIQESLGQKKDAEDSYDKGLRKAPDHPVLNYHMGKLMLADARRSGLARGYLEKAFSLRKRLPPAMAAEVAALMAKTRAN